MKIMFVCTANTCRSVMAEAIFKHIANENFEVFSSGIIAENGKKPSIMLLKFAIHMLSICPVAGQLTLRIQ